MKKIRREIKNGFHIRSKHRGRYDFNKLINSYTKLSDFVKLNKYGDESINFADPEAVLALNTALIKLNYNIEYWEIPPNYLCPPIPGRADYIHNIADLLAESNNGKIPIGTDIRCLDIGVGANCIYPIIGNAEYGWEFLGTDIDEKALKAAKQIINNNSNLSKSVKLRFQNNKSNIFNGVILDGEKFTVSICNPPFHSSMEEATEGSRRKVSNLTKQKVEDPILNFGGISNELWCEGGEAVFIKNMIFESKDFAKSIKWFTTLVSKKKNLNSFYNYLKMVNAQTVQTISMKHGNKESRILAWSF